MAYESNTAVPSPEQTAFIVAVLSATGHWTGGPQTAWSDELTDALRQYQIKRGLSVSGVFDLSTGSDMARVISFAGGGGPDPVEAEIAARYGPGLASMLLHEEVGPILRQAATEKWEIDTLREAIARTAWYQRNSESQRAWEALKLENPAEADRQRREREATVWDQAMKLGVAADPRLVRRVVEDSLAFGWSEAQTNDTLMGFVNYDHAGGQSGARAGTDPAATIAELKDLARRYHVILSDQQVQGMATRILKGETSIEAQLTVFQQQAKARYSYGGLADLIDRGVTPEDYFSNHKNLLARELEINPESIDWTDPKWSAFLGTADGKGVMRPMTLTESMEELRREDNRYGWWDTAAAGQQAADLALDLKEMFTGVR